MVDNAKLNSAPKKMGKRPRKTRAELEREALEICPEAKPKVDFTAALRDLKTR